MKLQIKKNNAPQKRKKKQKFKIAFITNHLKLTPKSTTLHSLRDTESEVERKWRWQWRCASSPIPPTSLFVPRSMALLSTSWSLSLSHSLFSCNEFLLWFNFNYLIFGIWIQSTEAAIDKEKQVSVSVSMIIQDDYSLFIWLEFLENLYMNNWLFEQWPKQLNAPLEEVDPEIADIIEHEKTRQWKVYHSVSSQY